MKHLQIITSSQSSRMSSMIQSVLQAGFHPDSQGDVLLFGITLDSFGRDSTVYDYVRTHWNELQGKHALFLIESKTELYTKSHLTESIHLLNQYGVACIGHPAVEWIQEGQNLRKWEKQLKRTREEVLYYLCEELGRRMLAFTPFPSKNLLVIHANEFPEKSNTMTFYKEVEKRITIEKKEVYIAENPVEDCKGCNYTSCIKRSEKKDCFRLQETSPKLMEKIYDADAFLFLAPNYNDALSARLTAIINRMTLIYRRGPFYNKKLFSIIISGNSGSDSVARQLIGAMNLNKGTYLPPNFYYSLIANDPGEISLNPRFRQGVEEFSQNLNQSVNNH